MLTKIASYALLVISIFANADDDVDKNDSYGVDVSFPIHHNFLYQDGDKSATLQKFGQQKVQLYSDYMKGCQERYGRLNKAHECIINEQQRMKLNLGQPREMTNYTDVGFKKIRLSDELWTFLREYWDDTIKQQGGTIDKLEEEYW